MTRADGSFRHHLAQEILRSERRRVLGLAAVLAAVLAIIFAAVALAPDVVRAVFRGHIPLRVALAVFLPFIAYELFAAALLTWLDRCGHTPPAIGRYANALIETTFPTLLIYLLAGRTEPAFALTGWPSLLYFPLIVLSTLRLDFALSAFTGAVAAVELFVLAEILLPLTMIAPAADDNMLFHLTRSAVLL
ncbi:MAG: hypothetical protein KIT16_15060, partial [Rhodospirillaceae bacterium]|nr:hypothetical protein [Rhodospirillaceae bacterium]